MRTRRKILAIFLCGTLILTLVGVLCSEREPVYRGQTLSYWLRVLDSNRPETGEAAAVAITQIGTNAVPWLVDWIAYEPSALATRLTSLHEIHRWIPLWITANPALARAGDAMVGFEPIGPMAHSAIPQLAKMAQDPDRRDSANRSIIALEFIGPDALPSLLQMLGSTNLDAGKRFKAARAISELSDRWRSLDDLHRQMTMAVPLFVQCLTDKDQFVAGEAASVLGALELQPNVSVPALTNMLQDTRSWVRACAATALGHFGNEALPAVPTLSCAVNDSDADVREGAICALLRIQPGALNSERTSLLIMLNSPDWSLRDAATNALRTIAPEVFKQ